VNYAEILEALRELVARERIEFLPLAPDAMPVSPYAPIQKYVLDLKNGAKPETAAEDLFTALCKDILAFQPTRQVGTGEGWVGFKQVSVPTIDTNPPPTSTRCTKNTPAPSKPARALAPDVRLRDPRPNEW
jgi:hypothetical protein